MSKTIPQIPHNMEVFINPAFMMGQNSHHLGNFVNDIRVKGKTKKDRTIQVDFPKEYQVDNKYKTELCKSYTETGFCPYGTKCRFAHGRSELFDKLITCKRYKQRECVSFFQHQYCSYGPRCHFRHEQRNVKNLARSFHSYNLNILTSLVNEEEIMKMNEEQLIRLVSSSVKTKPNTGKLVNLRRRDMEMPNNHCAAFEQSHKILSRLEALKSMQKVFFNNHNVFPLF